MEFKGYKFIDAEVRVNGRYRNRVEFKARSELTEQLTRIVDIGTEWNLKKSPTDSTSISVW